MASSCTSFQRRAGLTAGTQHRIDPTQQLAIKLLFYSKFPWDISRRGDPLDDGYSDLGTPTSVIAPILGRHMITEQVPSHVNMP
jgi:hypothetical protein